jgi:plasmid maintenance system killer protein
MQKFNEKKTNGIFESAENTEKSIETMLNKFTSVVNKSLNEMKSKITMLSQSQKDSDNEQVSENKLQTRKHSEKEFTRVDIELNTQYNV